MWHVPLKFYNPSPSNCDINGEIPERDVKAVMIVYIYQSGQLYTFTYRVLSFFSRKYMIYILHTGEGYSVTEVA